MAFWIISANSSIYNHALAFTENGFIDWKQTRHFKVGDIVFIYCTKPEACIKYKTIVEKVEMRQAEIHDDNKYWMNKGELQNFSDEKKYVRLRLVTIRENDGRLSLTQLKKNGLQYPPQSPARAKQEILEYLNKIFVEEENEYL